MKSPIKTIRPGRKRVASIVQGDIFELTRKRKRYNEFVTRDGVQTPILHTLFLWILKVRPLTTAEIRSGIRAKMVPNLTILKIYRPDVFPEGANLVGPVEMGTWNLWRHTRDGYKKLKPHKNTKLSGANIARLYRKLGVICQKPKELGL